MSMNHKFDKHKLQQLATKKICEFIKKENISPYVIAIQYKNIIISTRTKSEVVVCSYIIKAEQ